MDKKIQLKTTMRKADKLANATKPKVKKKTGITLQTEIVTVGE